MAKTTAMQPANGKGMDLSDFVSTGGSIDAEALVADGFSVERQHTLEAGQTIRGVLLGEGAPVEFSDEKTGEVQVVKTWRIRNAKGSAVICLLGAAQLSSRLGGIAPGSDVVIQHLGQVEIRGGRRANDYLVFVRAAVQ